MAWRWLPFPLIGRRGRHLHTHTVDTVLRARRAQRIVATFPTNRCDVAHRIVAMFRWRRESLTASGRRAYGVRGIERCREQADGPTLAPVRHPGPLPPTHVFVPRRLLKPEVFENEVASVGQDHGARTRSTSRMRLRGAVGVEQLAVRGGELERPHRRILEAIQTCSLQSEEPLIVAGPGELPLPVGVEGYVSHDDLPSSTGSRSPSGPPSGAARPVPGHAGARSFCRDRNAPAPFLGRDDDTSRPPAEPAPKPEGLPLSSSQSPREKRGTDRGRFRRRPPPSSRSVAPRTVIPPPGLFQGGRRVLTNYSVSSIRLTKVVLPLGLCASRSLASVSHQPASGNAGLVDPDTSGDSQVRARLPRDDGGD